MSDEPLPKIDPPHDPALDPPHSPKRALHSLGDTMLLLNQNVACMNATLVSLPATLEAIRNAPVRIPTRALVLAFSIGVSLGAFVGAAGAVVVLEQMQRVERSYARAPYQAAQDR